MLNPKQWPNSYLNQLANHPKNMTHTQPVLKHPFLRPKNFPVKKKNTSLPCVYRSPNFIRLNPGTQGFQLLILIFPYHILRRSPPRWWAMDGDFPWAVSDPPGVVFQEVKSNDARQQQRKNDGPNEFWMKHLRKSQWFNQWLSYIDRVIQKTNDNTAHRLHP